MARWDERAKELAGARHGVGRESFVLLCFALVLVLVGRSSLLLYFPIAFVLSIIA